MLNNGDSQINGNLTVQNDLTVTGDVTIEGNTTHTISTYGYLTVSKTNTKIIPIGVYLFSSNSNDVRLEIYNGSSWEIATRAFAGGIIYSDGSNMRFKNNSSYDANMVYRKF